MTGAVIPSQAAVADVASNEAAVRDPSGHTYLRTVRVYERLDGIWRVTLRCDDCQREGHGKAESFEEAVASARRKLSLMSSRGRCLGVAAG